MAFGWWLRGWLTLRAMRSNRTPDRTRLNWKTCPQTIRTEHIPATDLHTFTNQISTCLWITGSSGELFYLKELSWAAYSRVQITSFRSPDQNLKRHSITVSGSWLRRWGNRLQITASASLLEDEIHHSADLLSSLTQLWRKRNLDRLVRTEKRKIHECS